MTIPRKRLLKRRMTGDGKRIFQYHDERYCPKRRINECTIFRKFKGKKEVILAAMEKPEWNPDLKPEDFEGYSGDMLEDLTRFSKVYMQKVTPRMVKVSIGLRTPELYPYTAKGILKIPQTFKKALKEYFVEMKEQGKIRRADPEELAMMFLSMNFGFVFLKASFGSELHRSKVQRISKVA